jgi:CobQ-like glutamine amidotransferase family enzyme
MKLLHLYYDLMNLYGENGNMRVLCRHLSDLGIPVEVERKSVGDSIDFSQYSFIYCGCGTERNQKVALSDLRSRSEDFKKAVEAGQVILLTGNALEFLGNVIHGLDGVDYPGLGIAPFEVTENPDVRYNGDAVFTADWLEGDIVGFINKCTDTAGIAADQTLFSVLMGKGNQKGDSREGYRTGNLFGTYLTGPVLVKNPHWMKNLIALILEQTGESAVKEAVSYPEEEQAYQVTDQALRRRMETNS